MRKGLLYLQTALIAAGTAFAWTVLIGKFSNFYDIYGTLWRFQDCVTPNPFVTPCFYGAVAFVVALIWSVAVVRTMSVSSQRWLRWFLLFGTVFAFGVTTQEALHYYHIISGPVFACDPNLAHPLKTACFAGGMLYLASFVTSVVALRD